MGRDLFGAFRRTEVERRGRRSVSGDSCGRSVPVRERKRERARSCHSFVIVP